jgi:radical SAM protein with 4Fe4S-binding SPASM domain
MFKKINRISIEFTDRCNLNCKYCHQDRGNFTLNIEDLKSRVNFINKINILDELNVDLSLTGGEATVEPEKLIEFHKYLKNNLEIKNKTFSIMSNMTNLSPIISLLDDGILKEDRVGFSWDGIVHDDIRINQFDNDFFIKQIERISKTKYKNSIFLQISLHPMVIPHLAETIELLRKYGITNIGTYIIRGYQYKEEDAIAYDLEMEKIANIFIESYLNDLERIRLFEFTKCWIDYVCRKDMKITDTTKCRKLGKAIHITRDGNIYPCIYFGDHKIFPVGSMYSGFDNGAIEEFSKQYYEVPECINKNSCTIKHCTSCEAYNFHHTGRLQSRDESQCKMRKIEYKWFKRIISYLKPYITDYAIEKYWGKLDEQAIV